MAKVNDINSVKCVLITHSTCQTNTHHPQYNYVQVQELINLTSQQDKHKPKSNIFGGGVS